MKAVTIYTDGACSGNPGPGGWAAILTYNGHEKELSGGEASTTNNRMELSGVIAALSALTEKCSVTLYTDSQYIERAINEHWLDSWKSAAGSARTARSRTWSSGRSLTACLTRMRSRCTGSRATPTTR